jgi:hypothetical protein
MRLCSQCTSVGATAITTTPSTVVNIISFASRDRGVAFQSGVHAVTFAYRD